MQAPVYRGTTGLVDEPAKPNRPVAGLGFARDVARVSEILAEGRRNGLCGSASALGAATRANHVRRSRLQTE